MTLSRNNSVYFLSKTKEHEQTLCRQHYVHKCRPWYQQYATVKENGTLDANANELEVQSSVGTRRHSLSVHCAPIHPGGQRHRPSLRRHLPPFIHLQCWLQFMPYVPTGQAMEQFLPVQPGKHWQAPEQPHQHNQTPPYNQSTKPVLNTWDDWCIYACKSVIVLF